MDHDGRPTTEQFHGRMAALRRLAVATGSASGPARREALRAFGSDEALLLAAYQRWEVHLLARLDAVLELGAGDPHRAVVRAVEELGRTLPGLAALLREHADDPVLDRARERLAAYVDQACSCGRPHPLVASATPRRATSRCALRRAHALAQRWCRQLGRGGLPVHPGGALHASAGHG
jgi:AcrR family transcriptional regulator